MRIRMKPEWKLLCVDAINICGRENTDCLKCEVRCTEIIKDAQRKLLEYLEKYRCGVKDDMACGYIMIPPEEFTAMLKQLEVN